MAHVLPWYHVSGARADAVVCFSRRCAGDSPRMASFTCPRKDLQESGEEPYSTWLEQWLRFARDLRDTRGNILRYWVVRRADFWPQHRGMYGVSCRVGR